LSSGLIYSCSNIIFVFITVFIFHVIIGVIIVIITWSSCQVAPRLLFAAAVAAAAAAVCFVCYFDCYCFATVESHYPRLCVEEVS
jgi:succinate dehydrogenase/fumarate reductase cytochrome b subunit